MVRVESITSRLRTPLQPEIVFLALAGIFGLCFTFLTPPFQVADEVEHFSRIYQITKHDIIPKSIFGTLPSSIVSTENTLKGNIPTHLSTKVDPSTTLRLMRVPLNPSIMSPAVFIAASYSPAPYLPQVIGVYIFRHFNLAPVLLLYVARLFNLAAWLAIIYFAIRFIPIGKWAMVTFALTPMAVFQSGSASADPLTTAYSYLLVALILKLALASHEMRVPERRMYFWFILLVSCLLSLSKSAYFLIPFLVLIVPNKTMSAVRKGVVVVASAAIAEIWSHTIQNLVSQSVLIRYPNGSANLVRQTSLVEHHLFGFLYTLANTGLTSRSDGFVQSFPGRLGWADTPLPLWVTIGSYLLMAIALLYWDETIRISALSWAKRSWAMILAILTCIAVAAALYVSFTPVGQHYVDGIQGRYFIPVVALLIPAMYGSFMKVHVSKINMSYLMLGANAFLLAVSVGVVAFRFY